MTNRTDLHRPSEIIPADYTHLFSFSYPGASEPSWNLALLKAVRTGEPQKEPKYEVSPFTGALCIDGYIEVHSPWGKLPFFEKANGGDGCHVCGAHYRHGDAFLHKPSGEVLLLGHICGAKMGLVSQRGEWTARQKELAALRRTAEYIKAKLAREEASKAQAVETLRANPGLEQALELDHRISRDLKDKLWLYGSLTPKQVALAMKLAREAAEPKEEGPPEIDPPAGRRQVTGKVLSLKYQDSDWGSTLKMLVEVNESAGRYRLFGTVPAALAPQEELRGCTVRFTATVQPRETGFGFISRPNGGEVLAP